MRLAQVPDGFLLSEPEKKMILRFDDYFLARPLIYGEESMDLPNGSKPASLDLSSD